jgi:putative ABC transport system permease protein
MRTTLWNNLRGHARRLVATGLAVLFAVAFIAGTFAFTDTARKGYFDTYARVARGIDVSVRPPSGARLTPAQLTAVRGAPGIGAVDGRMQGRLALLGRDGRVLNNFGVAGFAVSADGPASLRSFDLQGSVPRAGEALIDAPTAAHEHWQIGDTVTVVTAGGHRTSLRLTGLMDFGVSKVYSGQTVVGLPSSAVAALTGETGYREIVAASTDQRGLVDRVRSAVGPGARVVSGAERRTELANDATSVATQFQFILVIFGIISLIVAAFVIYNTFAILLTQRVRETALLRCVGATRRQVFGLALAEAAAIGLVASVLGVALGVLAGYGLIQLLNRLTTADIPTAGIDLSPRTALIGLTVGVFVTVAAALMPAVRATRVAAMSAMRDLPSAVPSRRVVRIVRAVLGFIVGGFGVAVTVVGVASSDPEAGSFIVVAGGLFTFGGLLILAPLFIGPLTAVFGVLLVGVPGRLAVANARRNPGRTAVTSATLMIGIGLMALFSVVIGSVQRTADVQLAAHYPVDYVMGPVDLGSGGTIPASYAASLRASSAFAAVGEIRVSDQRVAAVDPGSLGGIAKPQLKSGRLADLTMGTVIVSADHPAPLGSTVDVQVGSSTARLKVVGVAVLSIPVQGSVDALVSWDQFTALAGPGGDGAVLVKAAPGVNPVTSRDAIDALGEQYPLVAVNSVADLRTGLETTINQLLALFGGLLATSVLISLFGIANTLALSVRERTRESAVVRALGLTRAQLRATLLLEALLMGLVGALVGIAFGLIFGRIVVTTTFAAIGPVVVVPWLWIGGLAGLAAVAATLAAVLPARHAARSSIVAAMAET